MGLRVFVGIVFFGIATLLFVVACTPLRSESAYAAKLPPDVRPSFDVFAQRCSKCHALSRPLDSGIDDDGYWAMYVRRMRLQPGSGISATDEKIILEFLKYYAREKREKSKSTNAADASTAADSAPTETTEAGAP